VIAEIIEALRYIINRMKNEVIRERPEVDLLEFIQSGEDDDGVSILKSLNSRILHVIPWNKLRNNYSLAYTVIDGSSRLIRGRGVNLGVASVVIFLPHNNIIIDFPPYFTRLTHSRIYEKFNLTPFIGLQLRIRGNISALLRDVYLNNAIRIKSYNDVDFYDSEYNVFQMVDEIRFSLETAALKFIAELVKDGQMFSSIVIIDGPVYPTPRVCFRKDDPPYVKYKMAYKRLIMERINVVRELESHGIGVVGIVKRLSDSYKLYRNAEINELFSKIFGFKGRLEKVPDDWIINEISNKLKLHKLRFPLCFGPFSLEIFDKNFNALFSPKKAPEKIMFYAHIPYNPFVSHASIVRIEMLKKTFEMYPNVVDLIIATTFDPKRGIPASLSITDRLSRIGSAKLFLELSSILEQYMILPYETKLDIDQTKRELEELLGF